MNAKNLFFAFFAFFCGVIITQQPTFAADDGIIVRTEGDRLVVLYYEWMYQ